MGALQCGLALKALKRSSPSSKPKHTTKSSTQVNLLGVVARMGDGGWSASSISIRRWCRSCSSPPGGDRGQEGSALSSPVVPSGQWRVRHLRMRVARTHARCRRGSIDHTKILRCAALSETSQVTVGVAVTDHGVSSMSISRTLVDWCFLGRGGEGWWVGGWESEIERGVDYLIADGKDFLMRRAHAIMRMMEVE